MTATPGHFPHARQLWRSQSAAASTTEASAASSAPASRAPIARSRRFLHRFAAFGVDFLDTMSPAIAVRRMRSSIFARGRNSTLIRRGSGADGEGPLNKKGFRPGKHTPLHTSPTAHFGCTVGGEHIRRIATGGSGHFDAFGMRRDATEGAA